METTKTRTHLTPEEVQEFIELGVEFGETACSWLNNDGEWSLETTETAKWYYDTPDTIYEELIPAPNLQEVLEALPKTIFVEHEDFTKPLECEFCLTEANGRWEARYEHQLFVQRKVYHIEKSPNSLIAATNLLHWICENHPETLTKTE